MLSGDVIEINREPHALLVSVNITERKRAEAELLKALEREQELGQLKSNFVSMVSHEFRTPLGVIQSSAEILGDYLDELDPGERKEHLQSIAKNTRRMADMMEEVLVLGRLDAGKMDFQPAPLGLRGFCARLVDEVLSANELACTIELRTSDLPSEAHADERLLRHIFTNLLSNAVKYSERERPVQFSVEREARDAVFTLRDRGIGIPEADQAWLFNAFHRGSNVGQRAGTGLGLVIVKRCVELHGGKICVESKVGDGTTVTVRLPVSDFLALALNPNLNPNPILNPHENLFRPRKAASLPEGALLRRVEQTILERVQVAAVWTARPGANLHRANIPEGNGRFTSPDRCKFFDIARGSGLECAGCLDLIFIKKLLSEAELDEGKSLLRDVVSLLVGLIRSNSPDRLHEDPVEYRVRDGEKRD